MIKNAKSAGDPMSSRSTAMQRSIDHVVVLGANGTMGYGSAAVFTQAVPRVTFLARTVEKAQAGLEAAIGQVRSQSLANRADVGSYDDLEQLLQTADLIFEAVAEDTEIKSQIFDRIDALRRPDSIVATVTSGLSINHLAAGRSDSFQAHFCGVHFFNPPNVIVGTELIPGDNTSPELVDFLEDYCQRRLGRDVIRTADTPGFAGNRVGFKVLNECAILAADLGPLLVDRIVGPYTGRALTPLATIDLVGWDVHRAIVDNIYDNAADEAHDTLRMPDYMRSLLNDGVLGNKSGGGFFSRDGDGQPTVLDPATSEYRPQSGVTIPDMAYIDSVASFYAEGRYAEGLQVLVDAPGPEAAVARKIMAGYISYSFARVGEVCQTITDIDRIMATGFNWAPPSILVDYMGLDNARKLLEAADVLVPRALTEAPADTQFFNHPTINRGRFFVAA